VLVLGRRSAKSLEKESLDSRYSRIQIRVPASTSERLITVVLVELRTAKGTARLGVDADRDIEVRRGEIAEVMP
jgi:hypothetical protein